MLLLCNTGKIHEKQRGVLVLLNCVPVLALLDYFSHSITMEALTPTRCQTSQNSPNLPQPREFRLGLNVAILSEDCKVEQE